MQAGAKAYFQTTVETANPGEVVVLLYEGAIKFLNQAKKKIEEKDYAQKGVLISKAMDVISELDNSLNVDKGGELAENLHQLYFFCNTRLLRANMDMDCDVVDEVVNVLSGLCDAFRTITAKSATGDVSAETKQPSLKRSLFATKAPAAAMPVKKETTTDSENVGYGKAVAKPRMPATATAQAAPTHNPASQEMHTQAVTTQPHKTQTAQQPASPTPTSTLTPTPTSAPTSALARPVPATAKQEKSLVAAAYASHSLAAAHEKNTAPPPKEQPKKTRKTLFSSPEKKAPPEQAQPAPSANTTTNYGPPGAQR